MNNVTMPEYEELINNVQSKKILKILILGNSITSHGNASNIGWYHKSGMAANQIENDYVHLLFKNLKEKHPNKNLIIRYSNWSQLERSPESFSGFNSAIAFKPDIIIFQLSDNLTPETNDSFTKISTVFLQKFKKKYVVSPFFMNASNYNVSKKIATDSNSTFIDISSISKDKINKASSEIRSDKSKWKVEGIGEHPGNLGMINISDAILKSIIQ